jgi:DNA-dependent protein kinase catalytic subunit
MTYLKYADEINQKLALNFAELSPLLSRSAKTSSLVLTIWNDFLEYMFSHSELSTEKNTFMDMVSSGLTLNILANKATPGLDL